MIVIYDERRMVPGYFVEAMDFIDGQDVAAPSPQIHSGGNTAFSFPRDLRYHFFNIYAVSKYLSEAINSIVAGRKTSLASLTIRPEPAIDIAKRIQKLPFTFFPDEMYLDVPSVKVIEDLIKPNWFCHIQTLQHCLSPHHTTKQCGWLGFLRKTA